MFPYVVCRSCGFPLGALYQAYKFMLDAHNKGQIVASAAVVPSPAVGRDAPIGYILDMLRITKTCCRSAIMTNVEFRDCYNAVMPSPVPATVIPKDK